MTLSTPFDRTPTKNTQQDNDGDITMTPCEQPIMRQMRTAPRIGKAPAFTASQVSQHAHPLHPFAHESAVFPEYNDTQQQKYPQTPYQPNLRPQTLQQRQAFNAQLQNNQVMPPPSSLPALQAPSPLGQFRNGASVQNANRNGGETLFMNNQVSPNHNFIQKTPAEVGLVKPSNQALFHSEGTLQRKTRNVERPKHVPDTPNKRFIHFDPSAMLASGVKQAPHTALVSRYASKPIPSSPSDHLRIGTRSVPRRTPRNTGQQTSNTKPISLVEAFRQHADHKFVTKPAMTSAGNEDDLFGPSKSSKDRIVSDGLQTSFAHMLDKNFFANHENIAVPPSDSTLWSNYFETQFTILEQVGQGSFSIAYRVRSNQDGCQYVIKKAKEPYRGAKDRQKKLEEVRIMWELSQAPHIVQLKAAWEQHSILYFQMEACDTTFEAWLRDKSDEPLDIRRLEMECWQFLAQISEGLDYMHNRGFFHLDLKPANIFLSISAESSGFKIGDFGIAASQSEILEAEEHEGDRNYLAPEVLNLSGGITGKTDIYPLGLMAIEMIYNIELPPGGKQWERFRADDWSDLPTPPPVSDALKQIIFQMAASDPIRRPNAFQLKMLTMAHIQENENV